MHGLSAVPIESQYETLKPESNGGNAEIFKVNPPRQLWTTSNQAMPAFAESKPQLERLDIEARTPLPMSAFRPRSVAPAGGPGIDQSWIKFQNILNYIMGSYEIMGSELFRVRLYMCDMKHASTQLSTYAQPSSYECSYRRGRICSIFPNNSKYSLISITLIGKTLKGTEVNETKFFPGAKRCRHWHSLRVAKEDCWSAHMPHIERFQDNFG